MFSTFCAIVAILALVSSAPAFSGFGATADSGSTLINVTNLNDSGPGSLRHAIDTGGNDIKIKATLGGQITLSSPLVLNGRSKVWIQGKGKSAPIRLKNHGLIIRGGSEDIIVQYVKVVDSADDGFQLREECNRVVLSNVTALRSTDGNIDITEGCTNVTVEWSLIGDTRSNWNNLQTKGMLVGNGTDTVGNVTLHHNLFINQQQRGPQISSTEGVFDLRGNVHYQWGSYSNRWRNGAKGNLVRDMFKSSIKPQDAFILDATGGTEVYVSMNVFPPQETGSGNVGSPFPAPAVPMESTTQQTLNAVRAQDGGAGTNHGEDKTLRATVPGTGW